MAADAQRRTVAALLCTIALIFGYRDAGADADAYVGLICGLISKGEARPTSKVGTTWLLS